MKRFNALIICAMLLGGINAIASDAIDLSTALIDPTSTGPGNNKAPVKTPSVFIDDHQLLFQSFHPTFTINVVGNGGVVYSTTAAAEETSVSLPTWLFGEYEIQLFPVSSSYYFYGIINL